VVGVDKSMPAKIVACLVGSWLIDDENKIHINYTSLNKSKTVLCIFPEPA
jgi:hypothetical protein